MMSKSWKVLGVGVLLAGWSSMVAAAPRSLHLEDFNRLRKVEDPQISLNGSRIAYTVKRADLVKDRHDTDIYLVGWDGVKTVRLTRTTENEHDPRWSPDGRTIAFLASPVPKKDKEDEDNPERVWRIGPDGGKPEVLTSFKGSVTDLVWSPDGKQLALVVEDPQPDVGKQKPKTARPIVIDRFWFKNDDSGYLTNRHSHLYLFDLKTRTSRRLVPGNFDELLPAFAPDGKRIAFVSKRRADPDRDDNWDLYTIATAASSRPVQLTTFPGPDDSPEWESRPTWSPDGKSLAYLQGGPLKLVGYAVHKLAVIPATGGEPRILTESLDRNVTVPTWSKDGSKIFFLLEDDRTMQLASVPATGGEILRLSTGRREIQGFSQAGERIALASATLQAPAEIFALESGGALRPLSRQNEWLSGIKLARVEETSFASKDGTTINGFLTLPPDYKPGQRYPTILNIHGGPVSQFANVYNFAWQYYATCGYAVVAANPRGSSGRGEAFSSAIYADWGNKDVQDVLAAVDDATARGVADPERLGLGGWSYGGILTNYTIARDSRFRGAVSGASIANVLAGYGTDQYVRDYEQELGQPWQNTEAWMHISFPFLHADRIATPTLFMAGEKDFNVPLLNSEQMYQALKSLGIDTGLVIYPGQHHGLSKPSYERDRLQRYVAWYDRYVKPATNPYVLR